MSDPVGRVGMDAISAALQRAERQGLPVPFTRPASGDGSFSSLFARAIGEVSAVQEQSEALTSAFVRGEPVELHQVMAAAEEASLSLELLVETRNKLTEAYRTMMNIQA